MTGQIPDSQAADSAPRRTLMAAERTYLAWLRTGLGAIGVSLAVGRVVPELIGGEHQLAYALLGAGYGALGIFLIAYAAWRASGLNRALQRGDTVTLDWWALAVTTAIGAALAIATIVMVFATA
jgi:putative membrane protein